MVTGVSLHLPSVFYKDRKHEAGLISGRPLLGDTVRSHPSRALLDAHQRSASQ